MSLEHDFLLFDRDTDGEWDIERFIHDERAIHLHDDLVRYMSDMLAWIPTVNPSCNESQQGLCMWGPTLIEVEGAKVAERVFEMWGQLFAIGPEELRLTGSYGWPAIDETTPRSERVTQFEGSYAQLEFERDKVVTVLQQLADWCKKVRLGNGRLCLYHGGV